jgi:hypothetical protein
MREAIATFVGCDWRPWAAGLLGAVAMAAGVIVAAPARADVSCPAGFVSPSVSPDCYFLYMMAQNHVTADQSVVITEAHTLCGYMANDTGADPVFDAAQMAFRDGRFSTLGRAGPFSGLAAAAYCPSYIRQS